jgi:hypothetical protein
VTRRFNAAPLVVVAGAVVALGLMGLVACWHGEP